MTVQREGAPVMDEHAIRTAVRERYARAATSGASCCAEPAAESGAHGRSEPVSCCSPAPIAFLNGRSVPDAIASASLGCGAPIEAAARVWISSWPLIGSDRRAGGSGLT